MTCPQTTSRRYVRLALVLQAMRAGCVLGAPISHTHRLDSWNRGYPRPPVCVCLCVCVCVSVCVWVVAVALCGCVAVWYRRSGREGMVWRHWLAAAQFFRRPGVGGKQDLPQDL